MIAYLIDTETASIVSIITKHKMKCYILLKALIIEPEDIFLYICPNYVASTKEKNGREYCRQ